MYLINRKRFILENIEVLLKADLSLANIEASIEKQSLPELQQLLKDSADAAIEGLKVFRYEIPIADYHRLCQQNYGDLFRMKDRFQQMQQTAAYGLLGRNAKRLYEALWLMLVEVESFLKRRGIKGLEPEELVPDYYLATRLTQLGRDNDLLRSRFRSGKADPILSELLSDYAQSFCARQHVSWQNLQYMEQLMRVLLQSMKTADEDLMLMHTVIRLDFNTPEAYQYCRNNILEALEEAAGSKRKLMLLSWHDKAIKQLLPLPGISLNPQYPALKTLLIEFVSTEISYLEAAEFETNAAEPSWTGTKKALLPGFSATGKFQLQVSQRVLAIWTQTLITMEVIRLGHKGQRKFTEFLADHFTTAGLEEIHPDSFRRRFKEKHISASETLISILEQMILVIKNEYIGVIAGQKK